MMGFQNAALLWLFFSFNLNLAFSDKQVCNIPFPDSCQEYSSYPNLADITEEERDMFHPVMIFPNRFIQVLDNTQAIGLASEKEIKRSRIRNVIFGVIWRKLDALSFLSSRWGIGKFDEDRKRMYSTFDTNKIIGGYSGSRTIHLGVDLGAPVGTKVHAFADGIVHSAGYNEGHGDYGFVLVIEHSLPLSLTKIWALYGHMDRATIKGKSPGTSIKRGEVIGRVGDCHENGGWRSPHCHFQLSIRPPLTHDMPGACSVEDRPAALQEYLDPRYVVGPLY